jgi:hypothetical protein
VPISCLARSKPRYRPHSLPLTIAGNPLVGSLDLVDFPVPDPDCCSPSPSLSLYSRILETLLHSTAQLYIPLPTSRIIVWLKLVPTHIITQMLHPRTFEHSARRIRHKIPVLLLIKIISWFKTFFRVTGYARATHRYIYSFFPAFRAPSFLYIHTNIHHFIPTAPSGLDIS